MAANERFHRLAWGPLQTEGMPHGLIAGGLVDGSVNLYNPARIIGSPIGAEPSDGVSSGALVTKMQKHSGPVRGLEFNSFSPNLLASGAEDGELCIWDLARPAQPSLYPALKGGAGGQPAAGEVSYLAWNKKVQHILASSSLNGTTVVWDLKRQRPVISFTDPNSRRRCSAMQWNPEVATQLIVASDDDRSPSLQIWDLRNSISPAREFVGHSKGVLAMAWSQADPGLLLTCGKDNRTLCWDTVAGEVLAELPASSNWNFDVQWSSTTPGVLSTSSFDGRVGLYNLQQAGGIDAGPGTVDQYGVQQPGPKTPMKKAPAWMRRPCGATFGFGGQLVGFGVRAKAGAEEPAAAEKPSGTALTLMKVSTAVEAEVSAELEGAVSTGGGDALKTFCETKKTEATATAAKEDEETWGFLGILFEEDARRELLKHLDFGEALVAKELAESDAEAEKARAAAEAEAAAADAAVAASAAPAPLPPVDGDEFFNNLPEPTPASPAAPLTPPAPADDGMSFFDDMDANGGVPKPPPSPPPAPAPEPIAEAPEAIAARRAAAARAAAMAAAAAEPVEHMDAHDAMTQRALVVGDYRAAVNACVAAGRHADALILANIAGGDLWEETRSKHIAANIGRPYMRVASAVVSEDLELLVKSRPLAKWRETLAILCTYAPAESWGALAGVLAGRLANAGNVHASILCHICAGDVDSAVQHWLGALPPGKVAPPALHSVLEKAVVLTRATGQTSGVGLAQLAVSYAEVLVSQGQLDAAITYLDMVPDGGDAIITLRDRIVRGGAGTTASSSAPAAPAPAPAQQTQSAYGQQTQSAYGQQTQGAYGQQSYGGYSQQQIAQPAQPTQSYDSYGGSPAYGAYGQQQQTQSAYAAYGQQSSGYEAPPPPSLPPQPAQSAYAAYDSNPVQSAYGTQSPMGQPAMGGGGMGAPPPHHVPGHGTRRWRRHHHAPRPHRPRRRGNHRQQQRPRRPRAGSRAANAERLRSADTECLRPADARRLRPAELRRLLPAADCAARATHAELRQLRWIPRVRRLRSAAADAERLRRLRSAELRVRGSPAAVAAPAAGAERVRRVRLQPRAVGVRHPVTHGSARHGRRRDGRAAPRVFTRGGSVRPAQRDGAERATAAGCRAPAAPADRDGGRGAVVRSFRVDAPASATRPTGPIGPGVRGVASAAGV